MSVFVRSLALCNALLLVLPQGWCCFLPVPTACPEQTPAKAADCCPCKEGTKQKPATPKPAPTQEPAKPFKTCCYCQPATFTEPRSEKVHLDFGPAVPLIASTFDAAPAGTADLTTCVYLSDSPPLQLLHCVWLC
jgi:hypothetical protein